MARAGERQKERVLDRSEYVDLESLLVGNNPEAAAANFSALAQKYEREALLHGHTMVFRQHANGNFYIDVFREETNEEFAHRIRESSKKRGLEKIEEAQRKKEERVRENLKETDQKFSFEQFVKKYS